MSSVQHRPLDLWISLQRQSMLQYNVQGKIHVILFLHLNDPPALQPPTQLLMPLTSSSPSSNTVLSTQHDHSLQEEGNKATAANSASLSNANVLHDDPDLEDFYLMSVKDKPN